jgi:hypothetical protein
MSYYPYYGYPYRYGYPYGGYPCYGYPYYPYSLDILNNDYKLNGLYNELDELNDTTAPYREFPIDVSMNHGLHTQLKQKNYELVQHIVLKNKEINDLQTLLKENNIDCSMNPKIGFPHRPRPRPNPHPYPHPHPHPWYCPPYCRDEMTESHSVHAPPSSHIIIPRAVSPHSPNHHYIIPPHTHINLLPCVLPPNPSQ